VAPLSHSDSVFVGGTPYEAGGEPSVPDWHFEGDIFAVLIYTGTLSDGTRTRVEDYLRNKYGPS